MSKEHLVSKCLFPGRTVYVSGFDWCIGQERCVDINSLQRKCLCRKHNNCLSAVDAGAKLAIDALEASDGKFIVNGSILERWLVKTAVNLSVGGNCHIGFGMSESSPGWPSPYLLAVAFGDEVFRSKMGAYFLFPTVAYEFRASDILIVPIHRDGKIGGFVFGLRGQFIFLNLYPGCEPPLMGILAPGLLADPLGAAPLHYRPASFRLQTNGGAEVSIHLKWAQV